MRQGELIIEGPGFRVYEDDIDGHKWLHPSVPEMKPSVYKSMRKAWEKYRDIRKAQGHKSIYAFWFLDEPLRKQNRKLCDKFNFTYLFQTETDGNMIEVFEHRLVGE